MSKIPILVYSTEAKANRWLSENAGIAVSRTRNLQMHIPSERTELGGMIVATPTIRTGRAYCHVKFPQGFELQEQIMESFPGSTDIDAVRQKQRELDSSTEAAEAIAHQTFAVYATTNEIMEKLEAIADIELSTEPPPPLSFSALP